MARKFRDFSAEEVFAIVEAQLSGVPTRDIQTRFNVSPATVKTFVRKYTGKSREEIDEEIRTWNKYKKVFQAIFFEKFEAAGRATMDLSFTTDDLARAKSTLRLEGGNPYDLKYNAKGRGALPDEIQATAPEGKEWRITATGKGQYVFRLYERGAGLFSIDPSAKVVFIPDSLPALVERYARDDEQALLARIRYNNLLTTFLGIATYSLQSHWKTSLRATKSPIEVDEMYVGIDFDGRHYVIPVEAKGPERSERLTAEQLLNNHLAAAERFPGVDVISVAAKVIDEFRIAMMRFKVDPAAELVEKEFERHYVLAENPPRSGPRPVLTDAVIRAAAITADEPSTD